MGFPYALSVRTQSMDVKHFRVYHDKEAKKYGLGTKLPFDSLGELLRYYGEHAIDGSIRLYEPRPKVVEPPMRFEDCYIDFNLLTIQSELGCGNFSLVFLGSMRDVQVAIKECLPSNNYGNFKSEAQLLHKLCHPRLVRFLGCCYNGPDRKLLIITEYMPNGSLKNYLTEGEGRQLKYIFLVHIIDQVVQAMNFLESVKVNHRNLRCANVLVAADGAVKVAGFGRSSITASNTAEEEKRDFPVRWTAPEAMLKTYSPDIKADVWSFGVLMFEVLTYGSEPYKELPFGDIRQRVCVEGYRLQSPFKYGFECDNELYRLMLQCWAKIPDQRPTFELLSRRIEEYISHARGFYHRAYDFED